jgi:hypothetical protein
MEGISFLVRVHNEEETLLYAVQSILSVLTIGFEILLLLNQCVGRCATSAATLVERGGGKVRMFEYNHTLSRPGYEMLATDSWSVHSPVAFLNWGLAKARYKWTAKWDADFVMLPALGAKINEEGLKGMWAQGNRIVRLSAQGLDGSVEHGDYFSSCVDHYRKDVFWETPAFRFEAGKLVRDTWDDVWIFHVSYAARLKPYWFQTGWFAGGGRGESGSGSGGDEDEAAVVRGRLLALERDFGMLPLGMGRSGTTEEAVVVAQRILNAQPTYVEVTGSGRKGG